MSYQNINNYNFSKYKLIPLRELTDISLSSDERDFDEEVIFSPFLIGEFDGRRMPLKFDFNSTGTTLSNNFGTFSAETFVSENFWNLNDINLVTCSGKTELCDVGFTGIDNGLVTGFTGQTIELYQGLYTNDEDKFNRKKFDLRFKMHPVTGFTSVNNRIFDDGSYSYNYSYNDGGGNVGKFLSLNGGFLQGFYKLEGYDYQVLPERFNWGWSTEFVIRQRRYGNFEVGLNKRYPENIGTFFYMGTRAENKFYHYSDGSPLTDSGYTRVTEGLTNLKTCECLLSASSASTSCLSLYPTSGKTNYNCSCSCSCNCSTTGTTLEQDPFYDGISNALSFRLSGESNPRLCVKTYRITGGCEFTGSCSTTGLTYSTGTSLTEWCSTRGIFDECKNTQYINGENWVQINVVFIRDIYFDDCDLGYKGGLKTIVKERYFDSLNNNSVNLVIPPLTHEEVYAPPTRNVVEMSEHWINEYNYRKGKLKFYVNGKLFFVVNNFEEIIPRPLNVEKEKQIGVPFNISLGGGTQGLHDNLTFSANTNLIQDPECLTTSILNLTSFSGLTTNIKLEEYFAGNFIGDISAFRFYSEPLNASQIKHNFRILKDRYVLLDPDCPNCIPPTPTPTPSNTVTPSITPTNTVTPSITPSLTATNTQTPTLTPSSTIYTSPFPTTTPTNSPTITQTPSPSAPTTFRAYLFIEPYTGSTNIGQWMYDAGLNFFGFTNAFQPTQNQNTFNLELNRYVDFTGWTNGSFPAIVQQVIPQTSGGLDSFDNPIVAYNFLTTEVPSGSVQIDSWYTWIIPTALTNGLKQNIIEFNAYGNSSDMIPALMESTIYNYTFTYSGSTIPQTTYRVYTTYPDSLFELNNTYQSIYFRGNSLIP